MEKIMTEDKKKRSAPRPATYIPKSGQSPRYPEVLAQQFDGEDLEINGFVMEPVTEIKDDVKAIAYYKTGVRTDGVAWTDIVYPGCWVCIAEGVQRFVMSEDAFKDAYKRKN